MAGILLLVAALAIGGGSLKVAGQFALPFTGGGQFTGELIAALGLAAALMLAFSAGATVTP